MMAGFSVGQIVSKITPPLVSMDPDPFNSISQNFPLNVDTFRPILFNDPNLVLSTTNQPFSIEHNTQFGQTVFDIDSITNKMPMPSYPSPQQSSVDAPSLPQPSSVIHQPFNILTPLPMNPYNQQSNINPNIQQSNTNPNNQQPTAGRRFV